MQSEGLAYRKSGDSVHKSIVHKILTNPIHYGEFDWDGKRYQGIHEPIISKELYERVQEVLREKGRRRSRQQKHHWAFQGLVSCGHCGCALTAELKKGKYVYYHCTGHKGKCDERYVREEELARQFGEALSVIRMDTEVSEWVVMALKASHGDEKRYHDETIATLQAQYQKLQNRIDAMYLDKLDQKISPAFYEQKSTEWRGEQTEIRRKIEKHEKNANRSHMGEGIQLLEFAQKAITLYEKQEMMEKRRLLNFVFSDSSWKDGRLVPNYRQPFAMLAVANVAYQKEKATEVASEAISEFWLLR
jgi:site-specific DNA recombinase